MTVQFERIGIIANKQDERMSQTLMTLVQFLQNRKNQITLDANTENTLNLPAAPISEFHKHCDLVIVIGGDGSFLNAARLVVTQNLPLAGINLGSLGFLTDVPANEIEQKIGMILNGDYHEEKRFLIQGCIGQHCCLAVNEIVLTAKKTAKMIEFEIYLDDQFVCSERSDGFIISTPTGSTAYSLSGGGPILHPTLDAIVLMPIFSHTLNARPIVVDANQTISIKLSKNNTANPCVSGDSNEYIEMKGNDIIRIQKIKQALRIIHPNDYDYFEGLRSKLYWGQKLTGR